MYLKSLTVKDLAGTAAAEILDFDRGLNVVVGDNEAGKSTLLAALRAAFFQKHRATGEAAKALAPYGRQVRPEVSVEFELHGTGYSLRKAFLQRPDAELSWTGGRLGGDAVEERLAELFRFSHPGRGESKLGEHQGAFGLLWVEQGRSPHGLDLGVGKDAVTASLEGEVGVILGGERGRALLAASKTLQDRFFTNTLRPKSDSPLKLAEDALDALRRDLAEAEAAHRDYEERLEKLARRRQTLAGYERDDAIAAAEGALDAAEERERAIEGRERDVGEAERELALAANRRDTAAERVALRRRLIAAVEAAAAAQTKAAASLSDVAANAAGEHAEIERLEAARAEAVRALEDAERDDERAAAGAERRRLVEEIARAEQRLGEAREVETALAALRAETAAQPFDAKTLKALEALEADRRAAAAAVAATAPTIRFDPDEGAGVTDETGHSLSSGEARPIAGPQRFHLEGFGWIGVDPGPGAAELSGRQQAAEAALRSGLAKTRVASLEEARRLAARAEERRMDGTSLAARLAAMLPEGVAAAGAALGGLRAELSALPPAVAGEAGASDDPKALRARRRACKDRADEAGRVLEAARRAAAALALRRVGLEADHRHRTQEAGRLRAELAEAEARRAVAALEEDSAAAELDRSAKESVAKLRRAALGGADPEGAARALAGARRALDELNRSVRALREEIITLESELRVKGASQLGETMARLGGEIEAAEPRVARLRLEADASRLLHATLLGAQREAREHWLGPIKAQVAPYMRIIHPECEIELDEATLEIRGLHRRGVEEEFKRLSSGAREQVAVVTRLALANVLKRGGHPAAVILDDALVNTDEVRLGRMHDVLRKASEELQIIVLTCRERDFRHLGGRIFRL